MVLERHAPGREASWAAGGMIAESEAGQHPVFWELATASARLYPEFVAELQDASGVHVDYRRKGTISFMDQEEEAPVAGRTLSVDELCQLEPNLEYRGSAVFLHEDSVDPRLLLKALLKAAKHDGVEIVSGAEVTQVEVDQRGAVAAITTKSRYHGEVIVNCAGAWADSFSPLPIPARPIKGQMLSLLPELDDN